MVYDHQSDKEFWKKFVAQQSLSEKRMIQFQNYANLLMESNKKFNLTRISSLSDILLYHFCDSLKIQDFINFTSVSSIADVGSGGGFPGIPIKIVFPHLRVFLIEVNQKKVQFLQMLIRELQLDLVEVVSLDWRTFIRKTNYRVDLFFARASLSVEELLRIFKPDCSYRSSQLIYWASKNWAPLANQKVLMKKEEFYEVGDKKRKFIFFRDASIN